MSTVTLTGTPTPPQSKTEPQHLRVENIGHNYWQVSDGERTFEVQRSASLHEADHCTCGTVHQPGRTARCAHIAAVEISIFYYWDDVESAVALECFHGVQLVDAFSASEQLQEVC